MTTPRPYHSEYSIERMRANGAAFVAGRTVSTALNMCIFYLVATRLPVPSYALFVWLLALGHLLRQLSQVGIDAIALNYVPAVHSAFGGEIRRRFLITLVAGRLVLVVLSTGILVVAAPAIVGLLGDRDWSAPLRWYAPVLVIEHMVEFLRMCIFSPLMRQGTVLVNLIVQATSILGALTLGLTMYGSEPTIYWVIGAYACGSGVALVVGMAQFWSIVRENTERRSQDGPPGWRHMIRFGLENYYHDLLNWSAGTQMMVLVGRRLLGVAELATFGFIENLYTRIERLVPGRFFMGLVRPNLIVRYQADASFTELNRRIVLVLKLSSCAWAALATFLVVAGGSIVALLSSGKYVDGYGLLIAFIVVLALKDLKRVVIVTTNTLRKSLLLRRGAVVYLIAVPTAIVSVAAGAGFYGLLIGVVVADLGFVLNIGRRLRQSGFRLQFDLGRQVRILAAAAVASAVGLAVTRMLPDALVFAFVGSALALPVYALVLWRLRPLRAAERQSLERLLGRELSWL